MNMEAAQDAYDNQLPDFYFDEDPTPQELEAAEEIIKEHAVHNRNDEFELMAQEYLANGGDELAKAVLTGKSDSEIASIAKQMVQGALDHVAWMNNELVLNGEWLTAPREY